MSYGGAERGSSFGISGGNFVGMVTVVADTGTLVAAAAQFSVL